MTESDSTLGRLDADGIGCTLTESEAEQRSDRATSELFPHLEAVESRDGSVVLTFEGTDEAVAAAVEFVRREHQCCSFAHFDIEITPHSEPIRVTISGEGADAMFEQGIKPVVAEYDPELVA